MSCRSASRLITLVLLAVSTAAVSSLASTVPEQDLIDLARASDRIVYGQVGEQRSYWNEDHSLILTEVSFQVHDALKGDRAAEVRFVYPGGTVGKLKVEVPGASAFRTGQEAVLFLATGSSGAESVVGLSQGRFDVMETTGPDGKPVKTIPIELAGTGLAPEAAAPGEGLQAKPGDRTVPLERFLSRVRELARPAVKPPSDTGP